MTADTRIEPVIDLGLLRVARGRRSVQLGIKRAFDLALAGLTLILASPFLVLVSLCVVIDDGFPIMFGQPRLGRDARTFWILKFRTMKVGSPDIRQSDGSSLSAGSDRRLTSVGKFLRTWSLDELPQLWNVVRGDMSLVGPRPDQADQLRFYGATEVLKLAVRPGITGLAQVRGRNAIKWKTRKRYDVFYVRHFSLRLDLRILLETVPAVLRRENTAVQEHLSDV